MCKVNNTEKLIENRWLTVKKESVNLPNGESIEDFYSVTISDAAAIVAITDDKKIILKKEYKHSAGEEFIEVPMGMFEPDEKDGLLVAKRELLERPGIHSKSGSISETLSKVHQN